MSSPHAHPHRANGPVSGARKKPVLKFIGIFALVVGTFYFATSFPWFTHHAYPAITHATARVHGAFLDLFGERTVVQGAEVMGKSFTLSVRRGCDAVEPIALITAGILAFPASLRHRAWGIAVCAVFLLVANQVRLASLYWTGVVRPTWFDFMHVQVWQTLFLVLVVASWVGWAWWTTRAAPLKVSHASRPAQS